MRQSIPLALDVYSDVKAATLNKFDEEDFYYLSKLPAPESMSRHGISRTFKICIYRTNYGNVQSKLHDCLSVNFHAIR